MADAERQIRVDAAKDAEVALFFAGISPGDCCGGGASNSSDKEGEGHSCFHVPSKEVRVDGKPVGATSVGAHSLTGGQ